MLTTKSTYFYCISNWKRLRKLHR